MKIFLTCTVISCLFISQTFSQVPSFDLAKYVRPILKRQSLDMATELNTTQFDLPFNPPAMSSSSRTLGGNLWLSYQHLHNDLQYQGNSAISLHIQPIYSSQKFGIEYEGNQQAMRQSLNLSSVHRWYNRKQYFWGLEGSLTQNYQRASTQQERMTSLEKEQNTKLHTDSDLTLDLPIVVGKGRLEPIQDARHGLFILHALEKQKLLAREINEQDILELAAHISQWKNRRYFDIRLQRIWELEQLNAYLIEQGIIEELSPTLFAIVQDMWSFGYQIVRWAGNRASIGIDPNIRWTQQTRNNRAVTVDSVTSMSEQLESHQLFQLHPSLFFAYVSEKPLSESWQRSFHVELEIGPSQEQFDRERAQNGSMSESKGSYWRDIPITNASLRYGMGYYPNTRTYLEAELRSTWRQTPFLSTPLSGNWGQPTVVHNLENALNVNTYYYISPRTRLTLSYGARVSTFREDIGLISPIAFIEDLKLGTRLQQALSLRFEYAWF